MIENNTENNTASPKSLLNRGFGMLGPLKNKYLVAGTLFLVWMLFFDPKDVGSGIGRWHKYGELQASEQHLVKQIEDTKKELGQLKNNAQTIEKYAREKYLMKKDNEDLFIVSEDSNKK